MKTNRHFRLARAAVLATLAALAAAAAFAQAGGEPPTYPADADVADAADADNNLPPDPPGRVGRIDLVIGHATLTDTASGQAEAAAVNWPVTGGQSLAVDAGNRVQIHIGSFALRLDGDSVLDIARIDDERIQLVLQRGSMQVHARSRDLLGALDLTTPRERIMLDDAGRYRLDVDRIPGLTALTAATGSARILTGDSTFAVGAGQRGEVSGEAVARFQLLAPVSDAFDDWVASLDRRDDSIRSTRFVPAETTGVESLDDYGQWRQEADYGEVWYPASVPIGWVPYRYGRWIWVAPWGWTWLDDAPWGFAPFHYGRWVLLNGIWGWLPGAYVARPIYAPCLVGWYGGTSVGWFPLGPGDLYIPGHRTSPRYVESINFPVVRRGPPPGRGRPAGRYLYQGNPAATSWIDRSALASHKPVRGALQPPPADWAASSPSPLAPTRGGRPRSTQRIPEAPAGAPAQRAPSLPSTSIRGMAPPATLPPVKALAPPGATSRPSLPTVRALPPPGAGSSLSVPPVRALPPPAPLPVPQPPFGSPSPARRPGETVPAPRTPEPPARRAEPDRPRASPR